MTSHDVIIVGGGAAGMFAAAVCAEIAPARRILVLEKGPGPLAKVRVSGGGRCNLTHECADILAFVQNYPRGGAELIGPFHRFGPAETMAWFQARGVPLVTLEDGCVFPRADTSDAVIQVLLSTARRGHIEIRTHADVAGVMPPRAVETGKSAEAFEIALTDGSRVACRKLLVATGGGAFIVGFDHSIEPCVPSLFTFKASDKALAALAGIVVEVRVRALKQKADGALLITHGGVSGPAILRLSSFGARVLAEQDHRFDLRINWCPAQREDQIVETLGTCRTVSPRKRVGTWSPLGLPSRLWQLLVARAGVDETLQWSACPAKVLRQIASQVSGFVLPVTGQDPHHEEFVTCGGIRLNEVNFKTMESRIHPGLYLAGEVLDIDGLTGGFNLQAAWTTGHCAAQQLALQDREPAG